MHTNKNFVVFITAVSQELICRTSRFLGQSRSDLHKTYQEGFNPSLNQTPMDIYQSTSFLSKDNTLCWLFGSWPVTKQWWLVKWWQVTDPLLAKCRRKIWAFQITLTVRFSPRTKNCAQILVPRTRFKWFFKQYLFTSTHIIIGIIFIYTLIAAAFAIESIHMQLALLSNGKP